MQIDWLKGLCKAVGAGLLTAATQLPAGNWRTGALVAGMVLSSLGMYLSSPEKRDVVPPVLADEVTLLTEKAVAALATPATCKQPLQVAPLPVVQPPAAAIVDVPPNDPTAPSYPVAVVPRVEVTP